MNTSNLNTIHLCASGEMYIVLIIYILSVNVPNIDYLYMHAKDKRSRRRQRLPRVTVLRMEFHKKKQSGPVEKYKKKKKTFASQS